MLNDLSALVRELNDQLAVLRTANRLLAARVKNAEASEQRVTRQLQGAYKVLADWGISPEIHEDLARTVARVLRRIDTARKS